MSLDLYPAILHEGGVSADSLGGDYDFVCNEIHDACKGFGANEDRLIKALGDQSPEDRCKVHLRFKQMFDKDLMHFVDSECGNHELGTALTFLATAPHMAECAMLQKAFKGIGTKELIVSSIMCGRSNREMELLKKTFFEMYTEDLGRKLDSELGGEYEKLIFSVNQAAEEEYDPSSVHTDEKATEDAEILYKMGQGKFGTNEAGLFKIICMSPPEHLKKVNLIYADKYGITLIKVMEEEFRKDAREAALFELGMKLKPYDTVAGLIDHACKGIGTNELLLTCTLIRYQGIMKEVMAAHVERYGKSVEDRVKSEVGGKYEKILLRVLAGAQ